MSSNIHVWHILTDDRFAQDKIEKRYAMGGGRGDFWDRVVTKSEKEGGMSVSHLHPVENILLLIFEKRGEMLNNASVLVLGGSETTATLLSAATYLLTMHPRVLQKLTEEIRTTFTESSEIDLVSVQKLKYLLAVLDESLRVHPPTPFSRARLAPKGGAMVLGKFVPENVRIKIRTKTSETNS